MRVISKITEGKKKPRSVISEPGLCLLNKLIHCCVLEENHFVPQQLPPLEDIMKEKKTLLVHLDYIWCLGSSLSPPVPFILSFTVAHDHTGCTLIKLGSFSPPHISFPFSTDLQAHVFSLCHTGFSTSALLTISLYYSELTHKLLPFNFLPLHVVQVEQPCGVAVDGDSNFTPCSCRSPSLPSLQASFICFEIANVTISVYYSSLGKKKSIQLLL